MPTYEYECGACGHRFEHFQSMTSKKLRKCPECERRKLVRLVGSGAGLIFKGSGFYETDYKRSGSTSSSKSESGESKSKASDTKKSEKSDTGSKGDKGGKASGSDD